VSDLARHYSRFGVAERVLLTGHSHQAWPDVAFDAQQRAWLDAASLVDDKWERAAGVAEDVRRGWRRLLNDPTGTIALGQNTHELVVRLLSAVLPMFAPSGSRASARRAQVITSDGEFHTVRRQLDRLAEEGLAVVKVAARPADSLAERMASRVGDDTACVVVSSVLFETAEIVPNLGALAAACEHHGATLLVDAYHHLNVVPFDVHAMGLASAFITGGGYKYCQLGEGNCFLRIPDGVEMRPVITGWFSEFGALAESHRDGAVHYGQGAARFGGATYDPTSHYRAAAVFDFHGEMQLTPTALREISRRQVSLLRDAFERLGVNESVASVEPMPDERRAGFLALRSLRARELVRELRLRGVWVDARANILRLGPAPYVADRQLRDAIQLLGECL
jgi:kynureninase